MLPQPSGNRKTDCRDEKGKEKWHEETTGGFEPGDHNHQAGQDKKSPNSGLNLSSLDHVCYRARSLSAPHVRHFRASSGTPQRIHFVKINFFSPARAWTHADRPAAMLPGPAGPGRLRSDQPSPHRITLTIDCSLAEARTRANSLSPGDTSTLNL